MSKIITAITQWFRSLLWAIAEIFLFLLDCLWKVVLKVGTLDIGGSDITSKFFTVMMACMVLFIVFKLVKIYVKFFIDDEYREKINLSKVLISIFLASMLITGMPLIYKSACSLTSDAIKHVNYWIPAEFTGEKTNVEEINMSDVLIQSGRVDLSDRDNDLGGEIKLDKNFDINATISAEDYQKELFDKLSSLDDEEMTSENAASIISGITGIMGLNKTVYKYFPTWSSIILEILLSIIALFIFAMTAVQIAMRSVICTMKYLLAPYMIATIIDPEDNSFGTWIRSMAGDMIANFAQIYFTYFVLMLCSNSSIQTALGNDWIGVFAKIALFVGGLLAVQEIPNVISQFFGGSGQSMMETLRGAAFMGTMMTAPKVAGSAVSAGIGMGASMVASGAAKAGNGINAMKDLKGAYDKAGGGASGFKEAGKSTLNSAKDKASEKMKNHGYKGSNSSKGFKGENQSQTSEQNGKFNDQQGTSNDSQGEFSDAPEQSHFAQQADDLSSSSSAPINDVMNDDTTPLSYNDNLSFESNTGQSNGYEAELNAAKYYGIEDADKMSRRELRKQLQQRGYKVVSLEQQNSQVSRDSYKTNLRKNRKKKGGE